MTNDDWDAFLGLFDEDKKSAALDAGKAFKECLREQLWEEHGDPQWRVRAEAVETKYVMRFGFRLAKRWTRE